MIKITKKYDESQLKERYTKRFNEYGIDPKSLGWLKGRQELRFQILSEISDLNQHSILDIGCGFGDFYAFLLEKKYDVEFYGVDIMNSFIEVAKNKFTSAHFDCMDFMKLPAEANYDFVMASGLFEFTFEDQIDLVSNYLKKMYDMCNIGISINFLSTFVDYQNENAFHADPNMIFNLCKKMTKRVVLRHDYLPYEFTVYLFKKDKIENGVFVNP